MHYGDGDLSSVRRLQQSAHFPCLWPSSHLARLSPSCIDLSFCPCKQVENVLRVVRTEGVLITSGAALYVYERLPSLRLASSSFRGVRCRAWMPFVGRLMHSWGLLTK